MVSLLKAWWGEAATAENDFCYDYLPRLTGSHSTYETVVEQINGNCQGYFLFGENPAVGSANGRMQRFGLASLDWLVVRDLVMIESATFWQNGPEIETGEMRTQDIGTEVFFLPAAAHTEKDGQFHQHPADAAVAPRGGRAGRGRAQRPVVRLSPGPPDPGQAGRLGRRDRPARTGPDLGLPDPRAAG